MAKNFDPSTGDQHVFPHLTRSASQNQNQQDPSQGAPVILPPHLMVSSADADTINAHIAQYTKWLIDNKLLFSTDRSQNTGNWSVTLTYPVNQGFQQVPLSSSAISPGTSNQNPGLPTNNSVNSQQQKFNSKILFDSSVDVLLMQILFLTLRGGSLRGRLWGYNRFLYNKGCRILIGSLPCTRLEARGWFYRTRI